MKTRRICLYGAPSVGKSTSAAFLFAEFKRRKFGPSFELVQEHAKRLAWLNKDIKPVDQLYIFTEQLKLEEELLRAGVDLIITDSPILLSVFYGRKINCPYTEEIEAICKKYNEQYPSLNVLINRGDRKYDTRGRWQDQEEAIGLDTEMLQFLISQNVPYTSVKSEDFESLWTLAVDELVKTTALQINGTLCD